MKPKRIGGIKVARARRAANDKLRANGIAPPDGRSIREQYEEPAPRGELPSSGRWETKAAHVRRAN